MKFSTGKPRLEGIRAHIASNWDLAIQLVVGYLDPHHAMFHTASTADTKKALAWNWNKIKSSLFRHFSWNPDFKIGKVSSLVAV